jgi:hypothetical protein
MAGPQSRDSYARLLRGVGSLLLTVGGLFLLLAGLTWDHSSVDTWTGLIALVAGVLFGLPFILEWLDR